MFSVFHYTNISVDFYFSLDFYTRLKEVGEIVKKNDRRRSIPAGSPLYIILGRILLFFYIDLYEMSNNKTATVAYLCCWYGLRNTNIVYCNSKHFV